MFRSLILYSQILILCLLSAPTLATQPIETHTQEGLRWPLDATRRITSTFGEYRSDRFHAGLDFSINGNIGVPCFAIDDGYISRIKTSFNGYGRVIYLTLHSGDIAVYGHLDGFEGRVETRLREEQLRQGRYSVELWFKPGELEYQNGDIVGYCGGTGAGAPHLHFELRTPRNEPYDPVLAGFYYDDQSAPYVRRVSIRALDGDSEVESSMKPLVRSVEKNFAAPVKFYGRVGISAQAHDYQQGGWSRLGVQELSLYVDDELRHRTVLDTFPYDLNRHSRLDFDYELGREGMRKFRRLYVTPGNELEFYDEGLPGGVLDSRELGVGFHQVRIEVVDHRGNRSEMHWPIEALAESRIPLASEPDTIPDYLNHSHKPLDFPIEVGIVGTTAIINLPSVPDSISVRNIFTASPAYLHPKRLVPSGNGSWATRAQLSMDHSGPTMFSVLIEDSSGTVYQNHREIIILPLASGKDVTYSVPNSGYNIRFEGYGQPWDIVAEMTVEEPEDGTEAPILTMYPRDYPFLTTFRLLLDSESEPFDDQAVMVYRERPDQDWQFLSNFREQDGYRLTAKVFSFESFSVVRDTIPPELFNATPRDGIAFASTKPRMAVSIRDEFSGLDIENCDMRLNGESVIWIYDPDADRMYFEPW
ncbi:MAG TPA: M23 family metallopeptidase, partial [Bacteroidetes bacterium]|nr:M23 family metallopeptidase [Bacteroidota bacterium]HEX04032.1 M23 family metallopeptidase [Bacteroidota bacterium]